MIDLGVLPGGGNSETNWITSNGLISGNSQNGLLDPVTGGWVMHGVLWKHDEIIDLGTLDGSSLSITSGVNSSEDIFQKLSIQAEVGYQAAGFKADARFQYCRTFEKSTLHRLLVGSMRVVNSPGRKIPKSVKLRSALQKHVDRSDVTNFFRDAGDAVVFEEVYGGELTIFIEFRFSSIRESEKSAASLDIAAGALNAHGNYSQEFAKIQMNRQVQYAVFWNGAAENIPSIADAGKRLGEFPGLVKQHPAVLEVASLPWRNLYTRQSKRFPKMGPGAKSHVVSHTFGTVPQCR